MYARIIYTQDDLLVLAPNVGQPKDNPFVVISSLSFVGHLERLSHTAVAKFIEQVGIS